MRRTKVDWALYGWAKIAKGVYMHFDGSKIERRNFLWAITEGPRKGEAYTALWVAMDAANKTPARFV